MSAVGVSMPRARATSTAARFCPSASCSSRSSRPHLSSGAEVSAAARASRSREPSDASNEEKRRTYDQFGKQGLGGAGGGGGFTRGNADEIFAQFFGGQDPFSMFFGGAEGSSIDQLRTQIILKNNWLYSKLLRLEMMEVNELWDLEYCNDKDLNALKP